MNAGGKAPLEKFIVIIDSGKTHQQMTTQIGGESDSYLASKYLLMVYLALTMRKKK